jgi:hypothetical protein
MRAKRYALTRCTPRYITLLASWRRNRPSGDDLEVRQPPTLTLEGSHCPRGHGLRGCEHRVQEIIWARHGSAKCGERELPFGCFRLATLWLNTLLLQDGATVAYNFIFVAGIHIASEETSCF